MKKKLKFTDKHKALAMRSKLKTLKDFHDQENIFLDFSAETRWNLLLKKTFVLKVFYQFESRAAG